MHRTVAALAPLLGLLACGPDEGVTVGDVNDRPEDYLGRTVTLDGEIEAVHGPGLFTLDGPGVLDDQILVWTPQRGAVSEGREVRVTGPVRRMVVAEIERELELDLDPELELAFERRPVMMSGDVTVDARDGG